MKEIRTQDAVGHILCHDITTDHQRSEKGSFIQKRTYRKGRRHTCTSFCRKRASFRVGRKRRGSFNENEAAETLYKISAGEHMTWK